MAFNDLDWNLRWLACDLCSKWDPHYGPTLALLNPLVGPDLNASVIATMGLVLAIAMSVSLVWVARSSGDRGVLVLLIAAVSPAWLLLLDRANFDAFVVLALVAGAWLIRRRDSLLSWGVLAALIWVNGTLKYYPFALGIALLPVLRLRRGWAILMGFLAATVAYMLFVWTDFRDSAIWNDMHVTLYDFPAYGRLIVVDRLVGLGSADPVANSWANLLVWLVVLTAGAWGVAWGSRLARRSVTSPVLAVGGGAVFLSAVIVGGFGAGYKGAFLVLAVPLLSLPLRAKRHFGLYTSIVSLALIAIAMTVAYNSLLSTLAGLMSAALAVGAGLAVMWTQSSRVWHRRWAPTRSGESETGQGR